MRCLQVLCACMILFGRRTEVSIFLERKEVSQAAQNKEADVSRICSFMSSHPHTVLFRSFFIIHTAVPKIKFWILFNSLMLNPMTLYLILILFQEFFPYPDVVSTSKYVPWKNILSHHTATSSCNTLMWTFHSVTGTCFLFYLSYEIQNALNKLT